MFLWEAASAHNGGSVNETLATEVLIAIVVFAIPAILVAGVALFGKIFFQGLIGLLSQSLLRGIKHDISVLSNQMTDDFAKVYDDTQYLRGNGVQTRNRLDQGARETESLREEMRDLRKVLSEMDKKIQYLEIEIRYPLPHTDHREQEN